MKIAIANDHRGVERKNEIVNHLKSLGHTVINCGTDSIESVDYPKYAFDVSNKVSHKEVDIGILLCGTGIGMSIAANKVKGAYAALLTDVYSAERAIKSNNSNIACLGAFTLGQKLAMELLKKWLSCEFDPNCASQEKVACYQEYDMNRS